MTNEPVLLKQYRLLRAVIDAPWATRLDHKIASHIIDMHYAKFGNARVSLSYLQKATSATATNIVASLRRIIEKGVINIIRQGIGTRPTEYGLNFDFVSKTASPPVDGRSTSPPVDESSGPPVDGSSTASSPLVDGSESYLQSLLTSRLTVSRNEDTHAVPTAPSVSGGATASPAGSAWDPAGGFEELWAAFPRKHQRAKAQAAYKALAPDPALHATLVAKAAQWAAHYRETGTEKKWWKHLHTWLANECWLEDLPEPYENPKAAQPKTRDHKPSPVGKSGLSAKTPLGEHRLVVIGAKVVKSDTNNDSTLALDYRIQGGSHDGREFSHSFIFDGDNEETRLEGQNLFADFRQAVGVLNAQEPSDFLGCELTATVGTMGRIRYGIGT